MDADAYVELFADLVLKLLRYFLASVYDIKCRSSREVYLSLLSVRRSPESHRSIAYELVECAAVLLDA